MGQNSGALPAAEAHHQQQQQLRCKVTPTDGNTSTSSSSTTTASRSDLRNNNTIAGFTINNSTAGDEREDVRRRRRSDSILSSSSLDAGVDLLPGATVIDNENPNIICKHDLSHQTFFLASGVISRWSIPYHYSSAYRCPPHCARTEDTVCLRSEFLMIRHQFISSLLYTFHPIFISPSFIYSNFSPSPSRVGFWIWRASPILRTQNAMPHPPTPHG